MIAGVKAHITSKLTLPGVLSVLLSPVVSVTRHCNGCDRALPSAEYGAASTECA